MRRKAFGFLAALNIWGVMAAGASEATLTPSQALQCMTPLEAERARLTLVQYLRATKDIGKAQVYFSFNEMKCPFDVRIAMNQPIGNNRIGEIGESVPERAFFLDWLSRQRLILPNQQQNLAIGKSPTVSVPCGVLNLGASGGGGASQ